MFMRPHEIRKKTRAWRSRPNREGYPVTLATLYPKTFRVRANVSGFAQTKKKAPRTRARINFFS
jgi:hypothetical protein